MSYLFISTVGKRINHMPHPFCGLNLPWGSCFEQTWNYTVWECLHTRLGVSGEMVLEMN